MRPFEQEQLALALRYGISLPKVEKLKLKPPGFSLGSCYTPYFSPSGERLVVPTPNGCFLWGVDEGRKLLKLETPSNPSQFSFCADGTEVLVRNEQGQFARLALPDGGLVTKFRAKFDYRLDGLGCLGPGNESVLQLAYGGRILVLDSRTGAVLLERQLESTGYSGEVYWFAEREEAFITQSSVAGPTNRGLPCALWRWRAPFNRHEPERLQSNISSCAGFMLTSGHAAAERSSMMTVTPS